MNEFDSDEFRDVFLQELDQRIEELGDSLKNVKKDKNNTSNSDDILRTLHSYKGLFSLAGYPKISSISHSMENIVIEEKSFLEDKTVQLLYQFNDELERFSLALKGGKVGSDYDLMRFDQLTQQLASIDEFMIRLGVNLRIKVNFLPECKVVSARAMVLINKLKEVSTLNASVPTMEEINSGAEFNELVLEITTQEEETEIKKLCEDSQDVSRVNISRILESVQSSKGRLHDRDLADVLSVRVNLGDLDEIIQLLGDLVVYGQFLREVGRDQTQSISRNFRENLQSFERTIANIQDLVIKMRLVPIETIVNRFPRLVREIALQEDKKADLIITGKSYGVDRSIIEQLIDPLTLLLKNAVSHGIEPFKEREKLGKDPSGVINLNISHERSDIIIEVRDDGRGIDYKKIRKIAIDKGIIDKKADLAQDQLVDLLLSSKISTSAEVSEISGRGVGLTQVKRTLDQIGGNIEVTSTKGEYTSFRLLIPLSVAITKVLLLSVQDNHLAIPMGNIKQILSVPRDKIHIDEKSSTQSIVLDEDPVPIVDLRSRLQFNKNEASKNITESNNFDKETVILWNKGKRNLGFIVDELLGERDVVIKPIHEFIQVGAFSGATVLEGGQVVLILDPLNFLGGIDINA